MREENGGEQLEEVRGWTVNSVEGCKPLDDKFVQLDTNIIYCKILVTVFSDSFLNLSSSILNYNFKAYKLLYYIILHIEYSVK